MKARRRGRPASKPLAAARARLSRPRGRPRKRPQIVRSAAPAIPPRLLDCHSAASYIGVSTWALRDLEAAGVLRRVRLPLAGDREVRRLLFDVRDLDRLVDGAKDPGAEVGP